GQFVAFDTDEYPILIDMPPDVIRYRFILAQLQKASVWIVLHVAVPRTLEALEAIDEPTGAGLHKAEADFWILIENAIKKNAREVDHLAKRMPQCINGSIRAHVIQSHVIVDPAVDADTACESIRFFVHRPVTLVPQLVLLSDGPRARQHCATKPEVFDDAAQFFHRLSGLLQGNQPECLEARALAQVLVVHPVIVRARQLDG